MKYIKLFENYIEEGVNDPGILKAFFMAGGPGSGKSFVAAELFGLPKAENMGSVSYDLGLKLVNSDQAFELLLKKANIDMGELMNIKDKDPGAWDKAMAVRDRAKKITKALVKILHKANVAKSPRTLKTHFSFPFLPPNILRKIS